MGNTWRLVDGVHTVSGTVAIPGGALMKDCIMLQDAKRQIVMGKLLSLCPQDLSEYVLLKNPRTMLEAAIIIQEKLDAR